MTTQNSERVAEIVAGALERDSTERAQFLYAACGDDAVLRAEVESLLGFQDKARNFIESPAYEAAYGVLVEENGELKPGQILGDHKVLSLLGEGGMGEVYLATDTKLGRQVAIKVVKHGFGSARALGHSRKEERILAGLNHPNIARLYSVGTASSGLPYFVMEYIDGRRLDDYCREKDLSVKDRLALFCKICAAVGYAHQNLIIHRDIKPANIRVTGDGEPKLLDFGIAKLLDPETATFGEVTMTLAAVMTPDYASPEQIRGENMTTASDVYSLGVVLYELLTGQRPYSIKSRNPSEIARVIGEQQPLLPSAVLAKDSNDSGYKVRDSRLVSRDLDNIILKALRKEPVRRYPSVAQFSDDIRRYLEGRPITARKDTFGYRATKFVKRNKLVVTAATLTVLAITTGLIVTIWQAEIARRERDLAQYERLKAERINTFLTTALSYSNPYAAARGNKNVRDATINQMLDEVAPRIETELAGQPEVKASLQRTIGEAYLAQTRFGEADRYLKSALETQLTIYGEDHLETARTLAALAAVAGNKGDRVEAEKYLQRALVIYHSQQQKGNVDVKAMASVLTLHGDMLWTSGDYRGADVAYSESLALASQIQTSDRALFAGTKGALGYNRYALGRLDEAEALLREAVAEYRSLPNAELAVAANLNPLAHVLMWKGNYDAALALVRESKSISSRLLGEDNYYFARSLFLEAYTLALKGAYAEAEKVANQLEEILNRSFPEDRITKANLYDTRAIIFSRSGRAAEGEKFGRLATELYQSSGVRGSNNITIARMHWAESLREQKKYEQAEKLLLSAYQDAREVYGAQYWRTTDVARELVKLYQAWNKPEEAARYR